MVRRAATRGDHVNVYIPYTTTTTKVKTVKITREQPLNDVVATVVL